MFMETYQRRRFRKSKEPIIMEMDQYCSELQDDQSVKNGVQTSTPLPMSLHCPFQLKENHVDEEVPCPDFIFNNIDVEVGSVYEINHSHLPHRTPVQLRSIRVAMVSEKTELNVAVRFPSMESLKTYFSNSIREMYPSLDEKFVMGTALAGKVLIRQVPSQEFAENKHMEGFWLVNAASVDVSGEDYSSRKSNCLTELKGLGMVRWGARRQVKFLERHKENINGNMQSSSSFSKGSKKMKIEDIRKLEEAEDDDDSEDEEDDEKDEEEAEDDEDDDEGEEEREVVDAGDDETQAEEENQEMNRNLKRKRYKLRNSTIRQKAKKFKREKKNKKKKQNKIHAKKGKTKSRELILMMGNPKDRWSSERYQLATKNLLEVMKAKEARAGNPILRPDLRAEARKRIGDTGLLDHLLKHMAGKLAPGGEERFRRRHNADGAMEYWLESADLVKIRKEAGVNDPFWIPPPGWKPGDCPTQDPICAKELRLLREEISQLKRNAREMVTRQQLDEEVGKLRREIEMIVSGKNQEENQAIRISSSRCGASENLVQLANSLASSKADLAKVPVSLEINRDQLMVIQDFAKGIQEEIKKLMAEAEGIERSNSALIVSKESGVGKEIVELEKPAKEQKVQPVINVGEEGSGKAEKEKADAAATAEKKAAKIERLKSGFRICKPPGTFLWPDMARNTCSDNTCTTTSNTTNMVSPQPQVVVQLEDLFAVPTPPSVSSTTALAPPQLPYHPTPTTNYHSPASPVKPLAERRAVDVTVPNGDHRNSTTTITTTSTAHKKTTPINLNDIPSNPVEVLSGNPSSSTHTTLMPRLLPDEGKRAVTKSWEAMSVGVDDSGNNGATQATKCRSSSASCLSSDKVLGSWLALGTANSSSDNSSEG